MSARRRRAVLTLDARQDLSDILLYTERQWGRQQRSTYQAAIRDSIRRLADYPALGRSRDELSPKLRSHPVGSHIIYYWVEQETLIVAHILHGRRDPEGVAWRRLDPRDGDPAR
jgi:toxin ParE1/3/4